MVRRWIQSADVEINYTPFTPTNAERIAFASVETAEAHGLAHCQTQLPAPGDGTRKLPTV